MNAIAVPATGARGTSRWALATEALAAREANCVDVILGYLRP